MQKELRRVYMIFTQAGDYVESIVVCGEDDEACQIELEAYLDMKQDCYGIEE